LEHGSTLLCFTPHQCMCVSLGSRRVCTPPPLVFQDCGCNLRHLALTSIQFRGMVPMVEVVSTSSLIHGCWHGPSLLVFVRTRSDVQDPEVSCMYVMKCLILFFRAGETHTPTGESETRFGGVGVPTVRISTQICSDLQVFAPLYFRIFWYLEPGHASAVQNQVLGDGCYCQFLGRLPSRGQVNSGALALMLLPSLYKGQGWVCRWEGGPANDIFLKNSLATPLALAFLAQIGTFIPNSAFWGSSRPQKSVFFLYSPRPK